MKITVNEANTIKNFSSVMTDRTKVISELVQNSRRAGATAVEISVVKVEGAGINLTVVDNGVGISDFNKLFTLSESGWDAQTATQEGSFGLGFFSTLYSCESLLIESKGCKLDVNSVDALAMIDFGSPVEGYSDAVNFTRITLRNVKLTQDEIRNKVVQLARFSSIDIFFNNELLGSHSSLRSYVEKGLQIIDTPFGKLVLKESFSCGFHVVLQDLEVYHDGFAQNVLFSSTLSARMPDRDKLIDEKEVLQSIKNWLKAHFADELKSIRTAMADDVAFLNAYIKEVATYANEILLDIDYLPASAFYALNYPIQRSDYGSALFEHTEGVFKHQIDVLAFEHVADLCDAPTASNFQYFAKAYIAQINLPAKHWFNDICQSVRESDFSVTCTGGVKFQFFCSFVGGSAVAADSISIEHVPSGISVAVDDDFMSSAGYSHNDEFSKMIVDGQELESSANFVIKKSAGCGISETLLLQAESYTDENESWLDTDLNNDVESFERQLMAAVGGSIEDVLANLLGTLPPAIAEKINGKVFQMASNEGKVTFSLVA